MNHTSSGLDPFALLLSASTEAQLRSAVAMISLTTADCPSFIERLMQTSLLEVVLAGMENIQPVKTWLIASLPSDASELQSQRSMALKVMMRISRTLLLPLAIERSTCTRLMHSHQYLEAIPTILSTVSSMNLTSKKWLDDADIPTVYQNDEETLDRDDLMWRVKPAKNKHPKRQFKHKKKMSIPHTNFRVFDNVGLVPPATSQDADLLINNIYVEVMQTANLYIAVLRGEGVFDALLLSAVASFAPAPATAELNVLAQAEDATLPKENAESVFPLVQPMKAALYFDSVTGFGDWHIQISSRAEKHLRETKKNDGKMFKIIVKKIKELSNGHFSDDNQKRLNGPNHGVPIYEAKMTRDSRLVYQIDCIPDYTGETELQVVKVYGVYTHAQLDSRLWVSMGYQLAGKGKEYIRRCKFRNKPALQNDRVFSPATFPPPGEDKAAVDSLPQLPKQDLDEIHSLLVLEKYVSFSQALLNSILLDWDIVLPFDLTPQERRIVEHTSSCYVLGRSGTGKTTTMLFKMLGIERAYEMQDERLYKPRQLFVTQSRVLAVKVEEYFHKLLHSLAAASQSTEDLKELLKKKTSEEEGGLVDEDEEYERRSNLPKKFSLLGDENYPLFLTFDGLCKLLEADMPSHDANDEEIGPQHLISYDIFLSSYWPHFPQSLSKGLDPSLVYSEFMGVIKGSEQALQSASGYLDRESYERLSHRQQATFSRQRKTIYDIFIAYTKSKLSRGEHDVADRTHKILRNIDQAQGIIGKAIDFLYVDEAQDNLLIDALLLRSICRNSNGLFWAGDTAQTISVGSSFRFNDLKSFLFRLEQRRVCVEGSRPPQTFQLAINYRSHAGIVNAAHSVINLIMKFWPYSIDILERESGVVDGLKPVFFRGYENDSVRYEQFLFGESGSHIEFGAQQAILVRNEEARDKLREQVGEIGLILTLYESKGLEFNDVLLYNFFEHSNLDLNCWRVVLNALEGEATEQTRAPTFDEAKHAGLCTELKFLYVAITRARKNMWIIDRSEKAEPMRLFWTSKDQIQNCTPGTDVPHLAVSSTPEEWAKQGVALFRHKQYFQAIHCFQRADQPKEVRIANAYYLREQARKIIVPNSRKLVRDIEHSTGYVNAAREFVTCAMEASGKDQRSYYRIASECFEQGNNLIEAADNYVHATEYDIAAKLYRKLGMFDQAVQVVQTYRSSMKPETVEHIIGVARLFYFNEKQLEKANKLFTSYEEELEYLEDFELDIARATLLESLGRISEAAELHLAAGSIVEASKLLLNDSENSESVQRGIGYVLHGLWQNASFGVPTSTERLSSLLTLTDNIDISGCTPNVQNEIRMFSAIAAGCRSELRQLGMSFYASSNIAASLLSLDYYFSKFPAIQAMTYQSVADELTVFHTYANILHDLALEKEACQSDTLQRLLKFEHTSPGSIIVSDGTFVFDYLSNGRSQTARPVDSGIQIDDWELDRTLKNCLCHRLKVQVLHANDMCNKVQVVSPCILFSANSFCGRNSCSQPHIPRSQVTQEFYNGRVRIRLQQIIICQTLHCIEEIPQDTERRRRICLDRLYEALFPMSPVLGTMNDLKPHTIPEFKHGLSVVRDWSRTFIHVLNPFQLQPIFMTTFIQSLKLSFFFCRDKEVPVYLSRAACCVLESRFQPTWYRRDGLEDSHIMKELASSIVGSNDKSMWAGFLTVRHIITQRVQINISILCEHIEHLVGVFILSKRHTAEGLLHQTTLPRSLLLSLLGDKELKLYNWRIPFQVILDPLEELLERLYTRTNAEYLLFERIDISRVGRDVAGIFITRICKILALLGYNSKNRTLQDKIISVFSSLERKFHDHNFFWTYKDYVTAQIWSDVVRCVRHMHRDMHMDEMVHLYLASKATGSLPRAEGIRTVLFSTLVEIPAALIAPGKTKLDAKAEAFVPMSQINTRGSEPNAEEQQTEEQEFQEEEVADKDMDGDMLAEQSLELIQPEFESRPPTGEENEAAVNIQKRFRMKLAAHNAKPKGVDNQFNICLQRSHNMEWPPRSRYHRMFLGPLPHILFCINEVISYMTEQKKLAAKRLQTAKHDDLETCSLGLTQATKTLKEAHKLRKELNPEAPVHRDRATDMLKRLVLQVQSLILDIPGLDISRFKNDLALGVKGIAMEKKPPKQQPKPELVVEDDF